MIGRIVASGRRARAVRRRGVAAGVGLLGAALLAVGLGGAAVRGAQTPPASPVAGNADLTITDAGVRHREDLDLLVFEQRVAGTAGGTTPDPHGALDGAPVLGYVFPTTLPPATVGFAATDGTLALAVTAHPDFDDTPLWDESADGDYANDGGAWHAHWVVLAPDERAPAGLAVQEVAAADVATVLPPTNPGLPLALDSPGFAVVLRDDALRVLVPVARVGGQTGFRFDAVTAALTVNTADPSRPTLGVDEVFGVLSGDLSLPATVTPEG